MSELTPCNHCTLENIRYRAEKKGLTVTLLSNRGGLDVYVHPLDVKITREFAGSEENETRQGEKITHIAAELGIAHGTLSLAVRGITWTHVPMS